MHVSAAVTGRVVSGLELQFIIRALPGLVEMRERNRRAPGTWNRLINKFVRARRVPPGTGGGTPRGAGVYIYTPGLFIG